MVGKGLGLMGLRLGMIFGQNFRTLVMGRCGRMQGQISGVNDCV